MGATDLIPGVSGGTIAVVLGIYDALLAAISGFFSRQWRRHLGFLFPLGLGMAAALVGLSRGIEYLLEHHYVPTQFFFIGLIVGILPSLAQRIDARRNLDSRHLVLLVAAAVVVASIAFVRPNNSAEVIATLTPWTAVGLFLAGFIASMAMLLPGISGSFILLLLGVYPTAIHALSTLNLPFIAIIGSGVGVGFIASSKGIQHVLAHYPKSAYAAIMGMIVGSIAVVFPGVAAPATMAVSVFTCLLGFGCSRYLGMKSRSQA